MSHELICATISPCALARHNHAFSSSPSPVVATCEVGVTRGSGTRYRSGMKDVKLMKTTQSGFDGFIKDEFTNLEPVGAGTKTPVRDGGCCCL